MGDVLFMSSKSITEFKQAMNTIKARGIVKTPNGYSDETLYRYDFNTGKFKPYDKNKLLKLFNRLYLNSYDVNYGIGTIIKDLDTIDLKQVENYYKYVDAENKNFDVEDIGNKINSTIETNKSRKREIHPILWELGTKLQHLINCDVFSNGESLYQYNGKDFNYIAPKDIFKLFKNEKRAEYISVVGLQREYLYFVNHLTDINSLITELNDYKNSNKILNECKKDYETIKNMIAGFD